MVIFYRIKISFCLFFMFFLSLFGKAYSQSIKRIDSLLKDFDKLIYNNLNEAENLAIEAFKLCEATSDFELNLISYINLVKIYTLKKDYKQARVYIDKAIAVEDSIKKTMLKIDLYNAIAYVENIDLNHNKSLKYYDKAIDLALNSNDSIKLSESYIGKASLYIGKQEFKEAKGFISLASKIADKKNHYSVLSRTFYSLGLINYTIKDSAIYFYKEALKKSILDTNKLKQGEIYSDLAFLYLYHSELDSVIPYINKSIKLAEEVGSKAVLHNVYYTLGYYYDALGDYKKSIGNHKKAINEYGDYVSLVQLSNAYIMLSGALWHNGNYKEAYDYQDKYIILNDSVFNLQKAKEFNTIRTKYEVEKKDAAIALLEKEKEIENNRRKWLIISSVLLIVALIVLFLFYRHKIKTKNIILLKEKALFKEEKERLEKERELKRIRAYVDGQEKERQRLAKEIHDGVGGQLASVNLVLTQLNSELKNQKIEMATNNISNSFKALRNLSHSLSKHTFVDKSFEQLLVELKTLHEHTNNLNIQISVYPNDTLSKIGVDTSHNLYRILQELFANIIKHAKASFVQLAFNLHNNILVVIVEDDGKGFDREKVNLGIGLKNIEERVLILNGKFNIDSTPTKGTQVIIEIPLINI